MTFRSRLAGAALVLAPLLAIPTMKVGESSAGTPSRTPAVYAAATTRAASVRRSASSSRRSTGTRRRRGRRAPPPGGVYARNAIVVDAESGKVLFEKNSGRTVPIASLTKLMTALVLLEQKPDFDREVEVTMQEIAGAGHTQLRNHERVRLEDLFHMSLMVSDNCATRVLARESGLSSEDFLAAMNRKALALGMTHTRYVEITGLDERNVSTAADIAKILEVAARHPRIHEITTTPSYEFATARRSHMIGNTNRLLHSQYEVVGGKTGFINQAGYCFATRIQTQGGRDLIAVVLGAPTNATRFADVVRLIQRTTSASFVPDTP